MSIPTWSLRFGIGEGEAPLNKQQAKDTKEETHTADRILSRFIRALIVKDKLTTHHLSRDYAIKENALSSVTVYGKAGRPKKEDAGVVVAKPTKI